MIAAYRRSYDAPMAEVEKTQYSSTNAAGTSSATLTTSVLKLSEENYIVDLPENYDTTPYIRIYFRTKDFSLSNNLKYRISSSAASAEYKVNEIFYATDYVGDVTIGKDTAVSAAPDGYIEGLKNNQLYYFYYPISAVFLIHIPDSYEACSAT